MLKKLTALVAVLAVLTFVGVGFTGEQIFDIIENRDPNVEFEVLQRLDQIVKGVLK